MRTRLLSLLSLLLLFAGGMAAPAQAAPAAEGDDEFSEIALEELAKRLDLTEEQQARIAPALQERNRRLQALSGKLDRGGSRREKLKVAREARDIQQEFIGKVNPVLTSGQKAEWERMRAEMRDKARERARGTRR
ncbi:MAG: hypothetical protein DIU62_006595 [Pseudomonadota bacterium]